MANTMTKVLWTLAAVTALLAGTVSAAGRGVYLTADVGYADTDFSTSQSDFESLLASAFGQSSESDFDESDSTYNLGAGYSFNKYFAAEVTYMDLGKSNYKGFITAADVAGGRDAELGFGIETTGYAIAALASYPMTERLSVYAKGGVLFSKTETTFSANFGGSGGSEKDKRSDEDFLLGIGVEYEINTLWSLSTQYMRVFDADSEKTGRNQLDRMTLGLKYRF
jgi:opacity protein-like surface antigen